MADEMDFWSNRADLTSMLKWLQEHRGEIVVIKFGGNAMVDKDLETAFAADIHYLHDAGMLPVVVHGGGPQISKELESRGIHSEFRGGLRVTSHEAMLVVREVLAGQVGPWLAALLGEQKSPARAISGETDGLFVGSRRGTVVDGEEVDLGLVGEVTSVDPSVVRAILDAGEVPVVSSVAPDGAMPGQLLNVNADSAAAALAVALGAQKLVILTDVPGLYRDWPNRESLISTIDSHELAELLPTLESGMIPKMAACLEAVDGGVASAVIIDGRRPHSLLTEAFGSAGTTVLPREVTA